MKSSGEPTAPVAAFFPVEQCSRNWRRKASARGLLGPVVAGPPILAVERARFTASAVKSYSLSYSSGVLCQYPISGSFQTSQYHDSTSARAYFATACFTHWLTSAAHFA